MKVSALLALASLFLASLALPGCGSDSEGDDEDDELESATASTCPSDSSLTYDNFGQAFFQSHCLACHGSSGPQSPKLETLAQIRANRARIDSVAAAGPNGVNTLMPKTGTVDVADREKLGEWLACGAPE